MDISNAILAKSDQLNAADLIGGPVTVTITSTREGSADQRVVIVTDVFGEKRPFKPSVTVLRVLGGAWGKETNEWVGRSMTLYREPTVTWAGEEIGGIRISALSHIDKALVFNLPTSKTKHSKSTIAPLPNVAPAAPPADDALVADWVSAFNAATTVTQLQAAWDGATKDGVTRDPRIIAAKNKKKGEL